MKRVVLLAVIILVIYSSISAQKLTEPKLLGSWIAGEDPSEFLLHTVMEHSKSLLQENPDGKLVVRICSPDKFSSAFIKTSLNPLDASNYNQYRLLVPYEKIFIARSSKCSGDKNFSYNQYWFASGKNTLEYEEIVPVNNVSYKVFIIDEDGSKSKKQLEDDFAEIVKEFFEELKSKPKAEGFIVHNSNSRRMKSNIEKVKILLKNNGVESERVKTVVKVRLGLSDKEKLISITDKKSFPSLKVIEIKR